MVDKMNLYGLTREELEKFTTDLGEKPFRGRQLYKWIYKNRVGDFEQMSDLRQEFRRLLVQRACLRLPTIAGQQKSKDGTEKFLIELEDGSFIESVMISDESSGRMTLCISSQVGCSLGCRFCATGLVGYRRNLSIGEIMAQPLLMRNLYGEEAFDNLVFMGMGEPLLNYDHVMMAVSIMTDSLGLMLGARRITISTSGIAPEILRLATSRSKVNLAVSLNAPDDRRRRELMPVARSYPLPELMSAVREWTKVYRRRVTFEYILFRGVNDSEADARALAQLIEGIPCKINLLAYNPVEGISYERPEDMAVDRFAKILYPLAPAVTVRKSRGSDIAAACGQLAGKKGY